jgi:hypothetical protein
MAASRKSYFAVSRALSTTGRIDEFVAEQIDKATGFLLEFGNVNGVETETAKEHETREL